MSSVSIGLKEVKAGCDDFVQMGFPCDDLKTEIDIFDVRLTQRQEKDRKMAHRVFGDSSH